MRLYCNIIIYKRCRRKTLADDKTIMWIPTGIRKSNCRYSVSEQRKIRRKNDRKKTIFDVKFLHETVVCVMVLVEQCSTHTAIVEWNVWEWSRHEFCISLLVFGEWMVSHYIRNSRPALAHLGERKRRYSRPLTVWRRSAFFGVCVCAVYLRFKRLSRPLLFSAESPCAGNCIIVSCAQLQRRIYQQKHTINKNNGTASISYVSVCT